MSWSHILMYMTSSDAQHLREWINSEELVAWIVLDSRTGNNYNWRAVDRIETISPQEYSIWHKTNVPLVVPTGRMDCPDMKVTNPYSGWTQKVSSADYTHPWFGGEIPGPYSFRFSEKGKEAPNSIGRSEFNWAGDHYRSIGYSAHPDAKKWWQRLQRFIKKNSTAIPWPYPEGVGRSKAYAFNEAYVQIINGRHADANP